MNDEDIIGALGLIGLLATGALYVLIGASCLKYLGIL